MLRPCLFSTNAWIKNGRLGVTPQVFRALYRSFSHRLVWAGFNATARGTGSKLLSGEPEDLALLKMLLERLRVWHIDQQYKSFQNDYFTVVHSKLDILVGYRDHVSGCVHRHATADKMMGSSFIPQPGLSYQRKAKIKVQRPDSAAPFIISSLRKSSQLNVKQLNADCRPLDTAIGIIVDSCLGDCESLLSFIYDFLLAACIWLSAAGAAAAATAAAGAGVAVGRFIVCMCYV
jgi:hypothetical protein